MADHELELRRIFGAGPNDGCWEAVCVTCGWDSGPSLSYGVAMAAVWLHSYETRTEEADNGQL